jgi:hypothetical protein
MRDIARKDCSLSLLEGSALPSNAGWLGLVAARKVQKIQLYGKCMARVVNQLP